MIRPVSRKYFIFLILAVVVLALIALGAVSLGLLARNIPDLIVDPGFYSLFIPYYFLSLAWACLTFALARLAFRGQPGRLEKLIRIPGIELPDWIVTVTLVAIIAIPYLVYAKLGGNGAVSVGMICAIVFALAVMVFSFLRTSGKIGLRYATVGMLVVFVFLIIGLPEVWQHTSANAAVFGRYDLDFFLLFLAYHGVLIGWGALSVTTLALIQNGSVGKINELFGRFFSTWWLVVIATGGAWLGWFGFRLLTRTKASTMPGAEQGLLVLAVYVSLIVLLTSIQRFFGHRQTLVEGEQSW